jgi:hypothetical protein
LEFDPFVIGPALREATQGTASSGNQNAALKGGILVFVIWLLRALPALRSPGEAVSG